MVGWFIKIVLILLSIENLIHRVRTEAHTWPIFYVLNFGYLFKNRSDGDIKDSGRHNAGSNERNITNP